jgi:hypothetical protein
LAGKVDGVARADTAQVVVADGDGGVAEEVADRGNRCALLDQVDGVAVAEPAFDDATKTLGAFSAAHSGSETVSVSSSAPGWRRKRPHI